MLIFFIETAVEIQGELNGGDSEFEKVQKREKSPIMYML